MELPMRFLVLLMLMVLALLAIFVLMNPIRSGSETAQQIAERNSACSNWSLYDCRETSEYLQSVKEAFGCQSFEECRKKCESIKYCLIV